jgi:hypothetical protein
MEIGSTARVTFRPAIEGIVTDIVQNKCYLKWSDESGDYYRWFDESELVEIDPVIVSFMA